MSSNPSRKWRRNTITQRDGTLAPLPDNGSLIDLPTGAAVAQLYKNIGYEDRPAWRVICRSMNEEGELKDVMMSWIEDPIETQEYIEVERDRIHLVTKRKRTKEEFWIGFQREGNDKGTANHTTRG